MILYLSSAHENGLAVVPASHNATEHVPPNWHLFLDLQSIARNVADNVSHERRLDLTIISSCVEPPT